VKLWWSAYPAEVGIDELRLSRVRKVIQNDDQDPQSLGSSSGDLQDQGCEPAKHRAFEARLCDDPYSVTRNDNDFPIGMVLSSYYFPGRFDGHSGCEIGLQPGSFRRSECKSRTKTAAHVRDAKADEGSDYTHVHRDPEITIPFTSKFTFYSVLDEIDRTRDHLSFH
jgi:alpha-amylase